jgi:hypothetical protein
MTLMSQKRNYLTRPALGPANACRVLITVVTVQQVKLNNKYFAGKVSIIPCLQRFIFRWKKMKRCKLLPAIVRAFKERKIY